MAVRVGAGISNRGGGFTLLEVIITLVLLGLVSAYLIVKTDDPLTEYYTQSEVLLGHLRYAQNRAMETSQVHGFTMTGGLYWLFQGTNPNTTANYRQLPDAPQFDSDNDYRIELSNKEIAVTWSSGNTIFFDGRGVPYTAYTDEITNTPLASELQVTVTPAGKGSPSRAFRIVPYSGYIYEY